jgi:hypothetical protein
MFGNLYFDRYLNEFLNITQNSKISMILLNCSGSTMINEIGNFIKRDNNKIDYLSYIPNKKIDNNSNLNYFDQEKGRVSIKIGRFVNKFLTKLAISEFNINSKDIEDFVNLYKSYFTPDKNNLKIVSGEEIYKYYNEENYSTTFGLKSGSLWNSCMRQNNRNKFMQIYVDNSNICKMLVFLTDDGKVRARAILWDFLDELGRSHKIMDRIYSIYDHDVYLFKSWAKENGYICKLQQSANTELLFESNGSPISLEFKIKLDKFIFNYYPYLDTFKYFDIINGILYNYQSFNTQFKLVQSDGSLQKERVNEDDYLEEDEF